MKFYIFAKLFQRVGILSPAMSFQYFRRQFTVQSNYCVEIENMIVFLLLVLNVGETCCQNA